MLSQPWKGRRDYGFRQHLLGAEILESTYNQNDLGPSLFLFHSPPAGMVVIQKCTLKLMWKWYIFNNLALLTNMIMNGMEHYIFVSQFINAIRRWTFWKLVEAKNKTYKIKSRNYPGLLPGAGKARLGWACCWLGWVGWVGWTRDFRRND